MPQPHVRCDGGHDFPQDLGIGVRVLRFQVANRVMRYLKGKSAVIMFKRHGKLRYKFGNRHFWAEGYYVSTVGLKEDTIRKYVREQEKHDQAKVTVDRMDGIQGEGSSHITTWHTYRKVAGNI